jgi:hypothetical protein
MTLPDTAAPPAPLPRSWKTPLLAILLLACVLVLTSCGRGTRPTPVIPPDLLALVNPIQQVGSDLTAPCPPIPPAIDSSLAGLGRNHLQAMALHHECAARHARLADAARERERIEAERIERARRALEGQ